MRRAILTLCIIQQQSRVLLGMKKRGFGAGRWNGFGGKVTDGESIEDAARREMREEAGIEPENLEKMGIMEFSFEQRPGEVLEVHIFRSTAFTGTPVETEEMAPAWYPERELPYDTMWPSDTLWLPKLLAGEKFRGRTHFGEKDAILESSVQVVDDL